MATNHRSRRRQKSHNRTAISYRRNGIQTFLVSNEYTRRLAEGSRRRSTLRLLKTCLRALPAPALPSLLCVINRPTFPSSPPRTIPQCTESVGKTIERKCHCLVRISARALPSTLLVFSQQTTDQAKSHALLLPFFTASGLIWQCFSNKMMMIMIAFWLDISGESGT